MKGQEKEKEKDIQKEKVKIFWPPNLTDQIFEYSPHVAEIIWYTRIWTVDLPFRIIMTRDFSSPSPVYYTPIFHWLRLCFLLSSRKQIKKVREQTKRESQRLDDIEASSKTLWSDNKGNNFFVLCFALWWHRQINRKKVFSSEGTTYESCFS